MELWKKIFLTFTLTAFGFLFSATVKADTLSDVVGQTLQTNPDVLIATKERCASGQQVKQAKAGYYPTLDFDAVYGREKSNNSSTGFDNKTLTRREYGLTARQNLFNGFFTTYEVKRTKAKTDADAYQVWGRSEEIALETSQTYIDVLRYSRTVTIAKQNVAVHQRTYDMIRRRGERGVARTADLNQAQGRLSLSRANLYSTQSQYRDAVAMFNRVTGQMPGRLATPPVPKPPVLPTTETQALQIAIANNPILKSANADIVETRAQHYASKSTAYPVLDILLEANKDRNLGGIEGRNNSYAALLTLNWNLFNGGADVARQRETAYIAEQACEIRNRTYRQVIEGIHLAWTAMVIARQRLPQLRTHRTASMKTARAYREQFKLGKRTLLDLLDAENEVFTSDTSYVNAQYDLLFAEYRLLSIMGRFIPFLNVALPPAAARDFQQDYPIVIYNGDVSAQAANDDNAMQVAAAEGDSNTQVAALEALSTSQTDDSSTLASASDNDAASAAAAQASLQRTLDATSTAEATQNLGSSTAEATRSGAPNVTDSLQAQHAQVPYPNHRPQSTTASTSGKLIVGHGYTIQLFAQTKPANMSRLNKTYNLIGPSVQFKAHTQTGKQFYVVIHGHYNTQREAQAAIATLPASLRRLQPAVRSLDSIRKTII